MIDEVDRRSGQELVWLCLNEDVMFLRLTDFHLGCGEKLYHGTEVDIFSLTPRTTFTCTSRVDEDRYSLKSRKKYVVYLGRQNFTNSVEKISMSAWKILVSKTFNEIFDLFLSLSRTLWGRLNNQTVRSGKREWKICSCTTQTQFATGSF